jgi:hypothetical protein
VLRRFEQVGHRLPAALVFRDGRNKITIVSSGKIKQSRNQDRILLPFVAAITPPAIPAIS